LIFWVASVVILLGVFIAIIVPITRARANSSHEYNATIYYDQLNEIKRDLDRGLLSPLDGEALKAEIEKRLETNEKNITAEATNKQKKPSTRIPIVMAILMAGVIPFMSYGLYFYLGSPEKKDLPFAKRKPVSSVDTTNVKMDVLVKKLRKRLDQDPDQLKGWILLGKSLVNLNRFDDASKAFKRALEIAPNRAEIASFAAETSFMAQGGEFNQEVRYFFKLAQKINPREHKALYYLGLDAFMEKKYSTAIQYWVDLISISPVGAPWLDSVRDRLIVASKAGKLKISSFASRVKSQRLNDNQQSPEPSPTQEDIKNANDMSEKERKIFIRSMVDRLAERLKSEPNDLNGWRRLARAYRVLGEKQNAALVEKRIIELTK
jgi:cytochrome c-type biogenesis protein CcmH